MIKVEVKINGVYTLVDTEILEKFEKGLLANNYNIDGTIDIVAEEKEALDNELQVKINEAKDFLSKTDKKILPYYEFEKGDNTLEWYVEERSKARAFIRSNT